MTAKMLGYAAQGGIVMIPIAICSVLALMIIIERLWSLRRNRIFRFDILEVIEHLLRERKIPEATTLCKRHEAPMTRLILVALLNSDRPKAEIKELIEEGNVRKISIHDKSGKELMSFPLSIGVVGALLAPVLAAIGALAALIGECSISVEREPGASSKIRDDIVM